MDKERKEVDLCVAWMLQVAEDDVTRDLDILDIGWPAIECSICLKAAGDDKTIGTVIGSDDE
jgi:hypothetical protein